MEIRASARNLYLPIRFEPDAAFAATQHALTHAVSKAALAIRVENDQIGIGQLRTIEGPTLAKHEALRVISLGSGDDRNGITHKGNPRMTDTERNVSDSLKAGGNGTARHLSPPGSAPCEHAGHKPDNAKNAELESKAGANWPDPCPLPESLLAVDPFKLDLMPEKLRPWVADVAERMQCPADFVAVSLVVGLGSLLGRKVVIRPQAENDWQECANMWALLIGRPGVLKSPAMEEALRPLKTLSAKAEEAFKKASLKYEVAANVAKLRAQENSKKAAKLLQQDSTADISYLINPEDEAAEPTLRRYIANDTNVASLGVLLQQNPNGLLVFRDELVSLLAHLDQEENASERGFYLTAWAGNSSYTFDRIGRGLDLHIDGLCLSLLGSTQQGKISQYLSRAVRGGRGDDGLIQRFGLLVWPDVSSEWINVDRWPDRDARTAAFKVFDELENLDWHGIAAKRDRGADGDEEGLPHLRFEPDAIDRFVEWRTDWEKRLRSGDLHPALESHLAKYRKLVPGLALICHLVDVGTGLVGLTELERPGLGEVSGDARPPRVWQRDECFGNYG